MQSKPDKVIVYRSQAEQMRDEFWWSEGYVTPTMAGDAILLGLIILIIVILAAKISERNRGR